MKDNSVQKMYYEQNRAQLSTRLSSQIQVLVASLAGLGIIIAQWSAISNSAISGLLWASISILYGILGVYYIDNERYIALLGAYGRKLESQLGIPGWERYIHDGKFSTVKGNTGDRVNADITFIAGLARYISTLGAAVYFGAQYFHTPYRYYRWGTIWFVYAAILIILVIIGELIAIKKIGATKSSEAQKTETLRKSAS